MQNELKKLDKKIKHIATTEKVINTVTSVFLIIVILFAVFSLLEIFAPDKKTLPYHDFDALRKINPDVCAWLTMKGTHIDYPVVKGKDNFEYLDKNFEGEYDSCGTLFLDYRNKKDFSDSYNVIYGHNMVGGKMFGDIKKYYNKAFFKKNRSGILYTPTKNYRLKVIGILHVNAYKTGIYDVQSVTKGVRDGIKKCALKRNVKLKKNDKILALSTCSGSMNDERDVVFCRMRHDKDLDL